MALIKDATSTKLLIQVSDMAATPVFAHPCLINTTRGFVLRAGMTENIVPDCEDPELIAWIRREKDTLSGEINGAGTLATNLVKEYSDWVIAPDPKDVRVNFNVDAADGGGYWQGKFHLSEFSVTGERGSTVECSVSLQSTGEITWTDHT